MTSLPCVVCGEPGRSTRANTTCSDKCKKAYKHAYDQARYPEIRQTKQEVNRAWSINNPGYKAEYDRQYRIDNEEKVLAARRKWTQDRTANRPDYGRLAAQKRYARKLANGTYKVTEKDIKRLHSRHRYLCAYCKKRPIEHLDHVIPLARGGSHGIGNLLPACQPCNQSKNKKLLSEWRLWLERAKSSSAF